MGKVLLTGMQKAIFDMRFLHGKLHQEIAIELKITRNAVTKREARIRQRFDAVSANLPEIPGKFLVRVPCYSTSGYE